MQAGDENLRADPTTVEYWVRGWALSRGKPPPRVVAGGLCVDVGEAQQKRRYVFPQPAEHIRGFCESIDEPWVFVKVCAAPTVVQILLPPRWKVERVGFMMTKTNLDIDTQCLLPDGYILDIADDGPVNITRVFSASGELAASGRAALVGQTVNFDQIETHRDHRRRGLASAVMRALGSAVASRGGKLGVLVATNEGRTLYESLGWAMHSLYTTAGIPDADTH